MVQPTSGVPQGGGGSPSPKTPPVEPNKTEGPVDWRTMLQSVKDALSPSTTAPSPDKIGVKVVEIERNDVAIAQHPMMPPETLPTTAVASVSSQVRPKGQVLLTTPFPFPVAGGEDASAAANGNVKKALDLHEAFKTKFEKPPVEVDPHTKEIVCSAEQFKAAQKMLYANFPELTSQASDDKQKMWVAGLLQVILHGDCYDPPTDCCFIIREMQGKEMTAVPHPVPNGQSPAFHQWDRILTKQETQTPQEHLRVNLNHAVFMFMQDNVIRSGNAVSWGDDVALIYRGPGDTSPMIFKNMNDLYIKILLETSEKNPTAVRGIIESYGNSDLLKNLQTLDLPFENPPQTSIFPEAVFKKILEHELDKYFPRQSPNWDSDTQVVYFWLTQKISEDLLQDKSLDQIEKEIAKKLGMSTSYVHRIVDNIWSTDNRRTFSQLHEIIYYSRMTSAQVAEIAAKTGCEPSEIEPLVRFKALEMLLYMNQANEATHAMALHRVIDPYKNPQDPSSVNLVGAGAVFKFSEGGQQLETHVGIGISVSRSYFERDEIEPMPSVARVVVKERNTSFLKGDPPPTVIPMSHVQVSWKIPSSFLDHLQCRLTPREFLEGLLKDVTEMSNLKMDQNLTPQQLEKITEDAEQIVHKFHDLARDNPDPQLIDQISGLAKIASDTIEKISTDLQKIKAGFWFFETDRHQKANDAVNKLDAAAKQCRHVTADQVAALNNPVDFLRELTRELPQVNEISNITSLTEPEIAALSQRVDRTMQRLLAYAQANPSDKANIVAVASVMVKNYTDMSRSLRKGTIPRTDSRSNQVAELGWQLDNASDRCMRLFLA